MVKGASCSCRELGFNSDHLVQLPVAPVSSDRMPSCGLLGYCMHMAPIPAFKAKALTHIKEKVNVCKKSACRGTLASPKEGAEHAKGMQRDGEAGTRADLIPYNSLLSSLPFLEVLFP